MMRHAVEKLRDLSEALLRDYGASVSHAAAQADALIEAELRGHPSLGLRNLPGLLKRIAAGATASEEPGLPAEGPSGVVRVHGRHGLGPVVAATAASALCTRMEVAGAAVAVLADCSALGMLAPYAEGLARKGFVGIVLSLGTESVEAFGGVEMPFGTSAAAIAVPTADAPFVAEIAAGAAPGVGLHRPGAPSRPLDRARPRDAATALVVDAGDSWNRAKAPSVIPGSRAHGLAFELMIAALAGSAIAPLVQGSWDAALAEGGDHVLIAIAPGADPALPGMLVEYLGIFQAAPTGVVQVRDESARARREHALREGILLDPALWRELQRLALQVRAA